MKKGKCELFAFALFFCSLDKRLYLLRNLPTSVADTFFWVRSEAKAAKENGMYDQFTKRFLAEIEKIKASLTKKHGTKKSDKVMGGRHCHIARHKFGIKKLNRLMMTELHN